MQHRVQSLFKERTRRVKMGKGRTGGRSRGLQARQILVFREPSADGTPDRHRRCDGFGDGDGGEMGSERAKNDGKGKERDLVSTCGDV